MESGVHTMRDYGMSLESIERIYGCVAEYNRCRDEEDYENRNYNRLYGMEPDYDEEIPYEEVNETTESYVFEVGKTYARESMYGGMVYYRCIDRTEETATFCETDWRAWADGISERESKTYDIERDEYGDEECIIYHSDNYDYDAKIWANMPDGFNSLRFTY